MTTFRYTARGPDGAPQRGELEAGSFAEAERRLREQGVEPLEVEIVEKGGNEELSAREAEHVVAQVADLSISEQPLASGLRAAADECSSHRVARALRRIALEVERGTPLDKVLEQQSKRLPPHVRGLVRAATRSGRLGPALEELVESQRVMRDVFWSVFGAVAYPLLILGLTVFLLVLLPIFIIPVFKTMFLEFDLALPVMTKVLIATSDFVRWLVSDVGKWFVLAVITFLLIVKWVLPVIFGRGLMRRVVATVPLVGPLWTWSGAASFSRLLAVLVENDVPMAEALYLTADGVRDPNVREACVQLGEGVEEGQPLSQMLSSTRRLPASLIPLVRCGEKTGELADALRQASDMFIGRIRLRALLLRSISPPLVFIFVLLVMGFSVISLFMPLVSLISGLS
jgi:general secretion pathway protein F